MDVVRQAAAGSLESSDIFVEIAPADTLTLDLTSSVMRQFGDSIRAVILDVARSMEVQGAQIRANDHGALECVIRARVETAMLRACAADKAGEVL